MLFHVVKVSSNQWVSVSIQNLGLYSKKIIYFIFKPFRPLNFMILWGKEFHSVITTCIKTMFSFGLFKTSASYLHWLRLMPCHSSVIEFHYIIFQRIQTIWNEITSCLQVSVFPFIFNYDWEDFFFFFSFLSLSIIFICVGHISCNVAVGLLHYSPRCFTM